MFTTHLSIARPTAVALALLAVVSTGAARAEEDEHAGHHPESEAAPADPRRGIGDLEALMTRIAATSDTRQRSDLLAQHLAGLRAQMKLVRASAEPAQAKGDRDVAPRADDAHAGHQAGDADDDAKPSGKSADKGGMMDGMMGGKMKGMMKGGMMKKHRQMEQRIDMLERMLQQLIEHEAVERELEQD